MSYAARPPPLTPPCLVVRLDRDARGQGRHDRGALYSTIKLRSRSRSRQVDEHDVRVLFHALDDELTAIRRDVEVADVEVSRELRQTALRAAVHIEEPEILVLDFPPHVHER